MNYRIKYTSVGGTLTGKTPGDTVAVSDEDARHLLALGVIESEEDHQARQQPTKTDEETARLNPYKGAGGWYTFPAALADGEPVKVQGREAALAELGKREATGAAQPASGQ